MSISYCDDCGEEKSAIAGAGLVCLLCNPEKSSLPTKNKFECISCGDDLTQHTYHTGYCLDCLEKTPLKSD